MLGTQKIETEKDAGHLLPIKKLSQIFKLPGKPCQPNKKNDLSMEGVGGGQKKVNFGQHTETEK